MSKNDSTDLCHEKPLEAARAIDDRLETELLGAWRAGYNWLHVYQPLETANAAGAQDLTETITLGLIVYPTHHKRAPEAVPTEYRYVQSYDLRSVSTTEMRAAMRDSVEGATDE